MINYGREEASECLADQARIVRVDTGNSYMRMKERRIQWGFDFDFDFDTAARQGKLLISLHISKTG